MKITDRWIKKQVDKWRKVWAENPPKEPVPLLSMKEVSYGHMWFLDGYLYGTGMYAERIQKYIDETTGNGTALQGNVHNDE